MAKYDELKRLAEAATPGPWSYDGSYICPARVEGETTYVETWRAIADSHHTENVHYIAAANPAAILELIAENERLRKDAERWKCVRNAIPMQSPYAVWREGSHVVLGRDADELIDNFLASKKAETVVKEPTQ